MEEDKCGEKYQGEKITLLSQQNPRMLLRLKEKLIEGMMTGDKYLCI